jgi:Tfp pilus assembly protein PilN
VSSRYHLNLAARPFRRYRLTNLALAVVLLLILGFGAWQGIAFMRYSEDLVELRRLEQDARVEWEFLGTQVAEVQEQLRRPEAVETMAEIRFLNSVIERKRFSWTLLLREIERLMPRTVRIVTLVPNFSDLEVVSLQMEARGQSVDALSQFLSNLGDSPRFSDVTVSVEEAAQVQGRLEIRWLTRVDYRPTRVSVEVTSE